MSVLDQVQSDWKAALLARAPEKDVLSEIKAELQMRAKSDRTTDLTDEKALSVMSKLSETFKESLHFANQASRADLIADASFKISVISKYLPVQLSEAELLEIVTSAISESGALSQKDIGKVMKLITPKTKGKADGSRIQALVKGILPVQV